jgi:hypothetical protein
VEHLTVYKDERTHAAFPNVIRVFDGDLLVAFREAPIRADPQTEQQTGQRSHYHVDPGSAIMAVRSSDDGNTWSGATPICPTTPSQDLNYAALTLLDGGAVLVSQHRWYIFPPGDEARFEASKSGDHTQLLFEYDNPYAAFGAVMYDALYFARSIDGGRTWSTGEPEAFGQLAYHTHSGSRGGVRLADGTLVLPLHGHCRGDTADRVFTVRSTDSGRTWSRPVVVAHDPDSVIGFHEPALERLPNGRLVMMLRTDGADGFLYRAYSDDDGWTWQGLDRTPLWGHPAHLLALRDGRVLCAYGYRRAPFGIRACVSEDGITWDVARELILRQDGQHRDLGYPNSVQLRDGQLLTLYYFHGADGIRYIGGTRYTV